MSFWNNKENLLIKQNHRWIIEGHNHVTGSDNSLDSIFFAAKSVDRPSYDVGSKQVKYLYSNQINFPQRVSWKPIKIEFYDAILTKQSSSITITDNKSSATPPKFEYTENTQIKQKYEGNHLNIKGEKYIVTMQGYFSKFLLNNSGYLNEGNYNNFLQNINNYTFKDNLKKILIGNGDNYITIKELDIFGYPLETWKIYNPLVTGVTFSKLDYSNDNPSTVEVDIVYDYAELDSEPSSQSVTRSVTESPVNKTDDNTNSVIYSQIMGVLSQISNKIASLEVQISQQKAFQEEQKKSLTISSYDINSNNLVDGGYTLFQQSMATLSGLEYQVNYLKYEQEYFRGIAEKIKPK